MKLEITTLIENHPDNNNELVSEHGLSVYIETDELNILFDTGQSGDFTENAAKLKKELTSLDYVIISHGHYDHCGGFDKLVQNLETPPKLLVGGEFFNSKYKTIGEKEYTYNGSSFDENYILEHKIVTKKMQEDLYYLSDNVMVFHNFERTTEFEKLNDKFFIKQGEVYYQDEFLDEVAMGIITEKGLVVIVGCSHIGIVNILRTITKRVNIPIYAVIGGTHLIEADETRIEKTILSLKEMKIQLIAVSHCTGEKGICLVKNNFPDEFIFNNTGNIIQLGK